VGIENTFSWSKSRDDIFKECKRKYYYYYYGSWGGWESDAPTNIREIYILKNLKNRYTWKGEVVHKVIARVLNSIKRRTPISLERAISMTYHEMIQDYRNSEHGNYRQDPKKKCGLFEHVYQQNFSVEERDILIHEAQACVRNFFKSEIFDIAKRSGPDKWLFIDRSEPESFYLEEVTIYLSPDFVFLNEKDELELVDWKAGKVSDTLSIQMVCYILYAMGKWSIPLDKMRVTEYGLQDNQLFSHMPSIEEIVEGKKKIKESIDEMMALLRDKKNNVAEMDDFPPRQDPWICKKCNFQKICSECVI